jgi:TPR repeat protein
MVIDFKSQANINMNKYDSLLKKCFLGDSDSCIDAGSLYETDTMPARLYAQSCTYKSVEGCSFAAVTYYDLGLKEKAYFYLDKLCDLGDSKACNVARKKIRSPKKN